jgi:hypothetical protein
MYHLNLKNLLTLNFHYYHLFQKSQLNLKTQNFHYYPKNLKFLPNHYYLMSLYSPNFHLSQHYLMNLMFH